MDSCEFYKPTKKSQVKHWITKKANKQTRNRKMLKN